MEGPANVCIRCGKGFAKPWLLKRHNLRKTPCDPILPQQAGNPDKTTCKFCGRRFMSESNMLTHIRRACKIAPTPKNGADGLNLLYEHTLQRQIDELKTQNTELTGMVRQLLERETATFEVIQGNTTNISTTNNYNINVFGHETVPGDLKAQIQGILRTCLGAATPEQGALEALTKATALLYSDPEHPENLTCYLPNVRSTDTMVHMDGGWIIQNIHQVAPVMTQKSLDHIFEHQIFDNEPEVYACGPMLTELVANEAAYLTGDKGTQAARTALISNRSQLERLMGRLPKVGATSPPK